MNRITHHLNCYCPACRKERTRWHNKGFWAGVVLILLLVAFIATADAQEVSSVRDSQYDWQCETQDGTVVSGHTRQDKAFQSCMNKALEDGATYIVRGGTYRVTAEGGPPSPPAPPPPPEPPPDDLPLVTFGPVTTITQYPNTISALGRDAGRWVITFTLNSVTGIQGLASRDEHGTRTGGHLSVWVDNGTVIVRHQDIDGGMPQIQLEAPTPVIAGVEHVVVVSFEPAGLGLWLNDHFEAMANISYGLTGNELPLTLAGLCTRCNDPGDPAQGPDRPLDGEVSMEIWAEPLALPSAMMLRWQAPTEYEDDTPIGPGELATFEVYRDGELIAQVDDETLSYEAQAVGCFTVTATSALGVRSAESNQRCAAP